MDHFLDAHEHLDGPVFAWLPDREVEVQVDLARALVHQRVVHVLRVQEVGPRPLIWIIDREINLKLENCTLVQALFDEVDAMPLGKWSVLYILNFRVTGQPLVRVVIRVRAGGDAEHTDDRVLLQELIVHFQDLVAGQELLVLRVLHLGVALALESEVRVDVNASFGDLTVAVVLLVVGLVLLLEVGHELLERVRDLVLLVDNVGCVAVHFF